METLPNEIIILIFESISKITDKRLFLKTCVLHNNLTKISMLQYEKNYSIKNFGKIDDHCVEKFTLELCHDGYFELIPEYYITPTNSMLINCLSYYNNLSLLELAKEKGCPISTRESVNYTIKALFGDIAGKQELVLSNLIIIKGYLSILKFLHENDFYIIDTFVSYGNAAKNNHLEILKYFHEIKPLTFFTYFLAYESAQKEGNVVIIKWLEEIKCNIIPLDYGNLNENNINLNNNLDNNMVEEIEYNNMLEYNGDIEVD